MKRKMFLLAIMLFLLFSFIFPQKNWKIVKTFNFNNYFITGIYVKGDSLFFLDKNSKKIYQYDLKEEKIIKNWDTPCLFPSGLSIYKNSFFLCDIDTSDDGVGKIYEIDKNSGNVVNLIYPPALWPTGICATQKGLWLLDDRHNKLFLLDKNDGTILKEFHSPANYPTGISYDGKYLYIGDRVRDKIYVVFPETGDVLYPYDAPGKYVYGISKTNKDVLFCSDLQSGKIFKLKLGKEKVVKYSPITEKLTFSDTILFTGEGNVDKGEIYFPLGRNRENQKIISNFKFSPSPPTKITVDEWGEKFAIFDLGKLHIKGKLLKKVEYTVNLKLNKVRWYIDPDRVGSFKDIPPEISSKYLKNGIKYELNNPYIEETVKKVVGNEKNLYWMARKLYNFVTSRVSYKRTGGWETAPVVLKRGSGSCSEYTFSYISLCRKAGIPARYVGSIAIRKDALSMDWVFHRWAEIYLPNYGWIPVDTSRGKADLPADMSKGFGFLDNRLFVTTTAGGPESYMGWSYNGGSSFSHSPNVKIKEFILGLWEPLKDKGSR